jgi:ADP-ribosylglycohydrolase/catechol 2,3-dioxygenase-like lactoylglutathione lyase family enzyme
MASLLDIPGVQMPDHRGPLPSEIAERAVGALLASAAGDALGWPTEPRGNKVGGTVNIEPDLQFIAWDRREGGRYAPFVRHVAAGAYSDDTQLTLAVARSLLRGDAWWQHFTQLELPVWTLYELGGGGAVTRAAKHWERGRAPWSDELKLQDRQRYFSAGGNGAVMRVAPHAIAAVGDPTFSAAAARIVGDGVTTHGHPRALLGALVIGYTTWRALRWHGRVHYGELIEEALRDQAAWSQLPRIDAYAPGWRESADGLDGDYSELWGRTAEEMLGLLYSAGESIQKGSLARDSEVLEELGAYGSEGSSGTRTAAVAIYLTSRYAAQPTAGLLSAAFARNTDTDTIAAITGALLGALAGPDWLDSLRRDLQDADYIERLATALAEHRDLTSDAEVGAVGIRQRVLRKLESNGDSPTFAITLPVFGEARVARAEEHATKSAHAIRTWWLSTDEGQNIAITKIRKLPAGVRMGEASPETKPLKAVSPVQPERPGSDFAWTAVLVSDLERATSFYRDLLELRLVRATESFVRFGQNFVVQKAAAEDLLATTPSVRDHPFAAKGLVTILTDPRSFDRRREMLLRQGVLLTEISGETPNRRFRLLDPDANVVELREHHGLAAQP